MASFITGTLTLEGGNIVTFGFSGTASPVAVVRDNPDPPNRYSTEESKSINIDSVKLLEIDRAVYNFFNKNKILKINGRKVPVVFGSWERFAQMQGTKDDNTLNSFRDHSGMLKLPIVSIRRTNVTPNDDRYLKVTSDGDPSIILYKDRSRSKFNQQRTTPYTLKWTDGNRNRSMSEVYDVYRLPWPKFIDIEYTVTFWASYIKHANDFQNLIWSDYKPGDMIFNDYFFYSYFTGSSDNSNLEDYSSEERIIRQNYELSVQAYIIDKDKVEIDRTPSRILLEERVVDTEELNIINLDQLDLTNL